MCFSSFLTFLLISCVSRKCNLSYQDVRQDERVDERIEEEVRKPVDEEPSSL